MQFSFSQADPLHRLPGWNVQEAVKQQQQQSNPLLTL